jgi:hypothetical protein
VAYLSTESVTVTTIADGSATAYTAAGYNGLLHAIVYTPDGTTPYSNNVVVTITGETSGLAIWSETIATAASAPTRYPRAATHTVLGAAALYAAAGTAVLDKIGLAGERLKIVLASGGNAKVGSFRFLIGD